MTFRKLSLARDEFVATAADATRRAWASFTARLNTAAQLELADGGGLAAVSEWEHEHGALTAAELATADRLLDRVLVT